MPDVRRPDLDPHCQCLLCQGFKLLSDVYIRSDAHLPGATVEKTVIEVALAAYDSSESGNKTRGEMKQAADM